MIDVLLSRKHTYTVNLVPGGPVHDFTHVISPLPYETAGVRRSLAAGCYIFTDMDRLSVGGMAVARELHASLSAHRDCTVLNDPSKSLTRLELLRRLEEEGINDYRVRPLKDWRELRFPLFIRELDEHNGPATPLLHSKDEVKGAITKLAIKGFTPKHLMAVEYLDTSDDKGIFRKYSVFRVGDRYVAHHLGHRTDWIAKYGNLADEALCKEELDFVDTNGDEALVKPIFDLANIQFGRIDYAFFKGKLVVWEINLNPQLGYQRSNEQMRGKLPAKKLATRRLRAVLEELDSASSVGSQQVPIRIHRRNRARFAWENGVVEARQRWLKALLKGLRVKAKLAGVG